MRPSPTTPLATTLSFDRAGQALIDDGTADAPCPEDRACPPGEQLALLVSGPSAARASSPAIAPFATAVLHTPFTSASLVALDPRARGDGVSRRDAGRRGPAGGP